MAPDPPTYPADENSSSNYDAALPGVHSDDSDNENEEQAYEGYTLLGQHDVIGGPLPENDDSDFESDNVGVDETQIGGQTDDQAALATPPSLTAGRVELAALWNSAPVEDSSTSIAMDDERSAQIKAAMAGFSLPPSAVPAWASDIPEELWRERILGRLQLHSSNSGSSEPSSDR